MGDLSWQRRSRIPVIALLAVLFLIAARSPRPSLVAAIRVCAERGDSKPCLHSLAADTLARSELAPVLTAFQDAIGDPAVANTCHVFGHYLGQEVYRKAGNLPSALAACDSTCYGSCYHGAAEAYVIDRVASNGYAADDSTLAAIAGSVTNCRGPSCDEQVDTIHGVGHALMFLTASDLPRSLRLCDLTGSPTACHIGVFMSNYQSLEDGDHPSRYIRRDDPTFPCTALDARYQAACYLNQAQFFVTGDILGNIALCQTFPSEFRERCFLEIAKHPAQQGNDVAAMHAACKIVPPSYRQFCIESIIVNLHGKSSRDVADMAALCQVAEPEYKRGCYERMRSVLLNQLGDAAGRRAACANITEETHAEWCRDGAVNPKFMLRAALRSRSCRWSWRWLRYVYRINR